MGILTMKLFVSAAFSLLLSQANAGFMQMQYDFVTLYRNNSASRSLPETLMGTFDEINQYGCWCYFENDHGMGHGQTLDHFDGLCKILANGYDCIKMDLGASCIPWETDYNSGITVSSNGIVDGCQNQNPGADDCVINTCAVEGQFVLQIFAGIIYNAQQLDDGLKVNNGFQQDQVCNYGTGQVDGPVQCCGAYPERFKYRSNNGMTSCCTQTLFDVNSMECCADGSAQLIGSCP